MTSNFQFPKFLSFFLLLFFVSKGIVAQTGNNVPFSTNPFGANPITNPLKNHNPNCKTLLLVCNDSLYCNWLP